MQGQRASVMKRAIKNQRERRRQSKSFRRFCNLCLRPLCKGSFNCFIHLTQELTEVHQLYRAWKFYKYSSKDKSINCLNCLNHLDSLLLMVKPWIDSGLQVVTHNNLTSNSPSNPKIRNDNQKRSNGKEEK